MTNERSLSEYAGPEVWSKAVLLFPRSSLPLLDLGGSNPSANKPAPFPWTELKILPGKNDMVLDLVIDGEQ